MMLLFSVLLTVFLLGLVAPIFAEPLSEKYYTQPYWIYQIEIEYVGNSPISVFWDDVEIRNPVPDEGLNTLEIEVHATNNETILKIFDLDDANNLSADVRAFDVVEVRPMSVDEIEHAKSVGFQEPKDIRIAELEDRVSFLENKNAELVETIEQLQNQISGLNSGTETTNFKSELICVDKVWMESNSGRIACVSPFTATVLVERGWGNMLEEDASLES